MVYIVIFVLGAIVGSFLTVCVYRMPRKQSIISPGSHCPRCGKHIAWHDNIPILSYIILKARCRHCGKKIPARYFLIELLSAFAALVLYARYGLTPDLFILFALSAALIVVTFIDLEFKEIPDEITLPGIVIGLAACFFYPGLAGKASSKMALVDSFAGFLVGGGSIYLLGFLGEIIFRRQAMGGGDVKLLAMIGAFLGWKLVLLVFFLAPFFGSVVGIIARFRYGKDVIPYGPHLALAAFIVILWGKRILDFLFV